AWVRVDELSQFEFPPADLPVLQALRLPERYLITGAARDDADFSARLRHALAAGVRLVQLRAPELSLQDYRRRAGLARADCRAYGAQLLLNAPVEWLHNIPADGVHLTGTRLCALSSRPLATPLWVAASCHNAEDLAHAQRIGVDFVVLSPVQATPSHPHATPLGWSRFAALTAAAAMPVYALGGVGEQQLAMAWEHGAQGVAGIRAWWG
ncbi:MAG: Nudix family hydrolase, partial [Pseudomonadota bacterium]